MLICPVCKTRLKRNSFGYSCKKGHRFDRAAQGYVNLLTARHSGSGDDKGMVRARTDFLSKGYYRPLAERVAETAVKLTEGAETPVIIDCGCGEGYYTNILAEKLPRAEVCGCDLSVSAVRHGASEAAARKLTNVTFFAASSFELPFADRSADLIVSIFSPVAAEEFGRVLKKGGRLVIVSPSPIHLYGLKSVLYDEPYLNKPNEYGLKSFAPAGEERLEYKITLGSRKEIADLYAMTPYYYKTPPEGRERLSQLETLETDCGFDISVFRKK